MLAIMVGTLLAMGFRAVFGMESRLALLFYDDAFYYYQVAANLGAGVGSTFDGITTTNGYHPLWCWLLIPIFVLIDSPGLALRLTAGVWFLLAAAMPVAVWWALRRRSGEAGALLAAAFFALHPWLALHLRRPNGLETPLFALLVVLFAGLFQRSLAGAGDQPPRAFRLAGLGGLLGLVILARVDGGFLAIAAALLLLLHLVRGHGFPVAARSVGMMALAATMVAGPSLMWNAVKFGSPVPISGRVVSAWQDPAREALGGTASVAFLRQRLAYATHRLPRRLARYSLAGTPVARWVWGSGRAGGMLLLVMAMILAAAALARRRRRGRISEDALALLVTFAVFHGLAYAAWFWVGGEVIFRLYYFVPESLAAAGVVGTLLGAGVERLLSRDGLRLAAAGAVAVIMAVWVLMVSSAHLSRVDAIPGAVADHYVYGWVKERLPESAVLAAIGSGRLGYFSGRPAVDLDCLISDPACLQAIRDDTMDRYVARMPITHLVGGRATLKGFDPARPDVPPDPRIGLGEILYRLASRHGCRLREVPDPFDTSVVVEVLCPVGEDPH